jgi:ABC-type amino acid transport substrate-binding protein
MTAASARHRWGSVRVGEAIRQIDTLRIAHVNLSDEFLEPFRRQLPEAEFVGLDTAAAFFDNGSAAFDALLTSVESGFAYSLIHPDFEAVVPADPQVSVPLFYAVGAKDRAFRDFLDYWIRLKRDDGTTQAFYDHWILGKFAEDPQPQWSVIRNVLGWVD